MPENYWISLGCWFILFNLITFFMMGIDKYKARKKKYRTPEKNFFIFSAIGGAFGCFIGMRIFHHKTLHKHFKYGIPAMVAWNTILYGGIIWLAA